ncbi:E3 ubiquitin ligase BIG BROTHER-related-like [Cornus florida]|uniref:E3 ubiquitin ligase BIG BROTHER-related-like n=1 Tax=Cornus florida TaxID=4283 RepID=UPI0028A1B129|nr:E3 ubiquitin ligase BIG BROTHER-related-like [Cornus florida]
MAVIENINDVQIRVFEWNQRMISKNDVWDDLGGLLILRVSTNMVVGQVKTELTIKKVLNFPFLLHSLVSQDSMVDFTEVFLKESNAHILSEVVSKWLFDNFQFRFLPSRNHGIVIVVDVSVESTSCVFNCTHSAEDFRDDEEEEEEYNNGCVEYGNVEVGSSNTLPVEENHDHDHDQEEEEAEDTDDDDDSIDLNVEEEDEDLMDDDDEGIYSEARDEVLDILNNFLDSKSIVTESICLKEIEVAVKVDRLIDDGSRADKCPICLEGLSVGIDVATTPCSHVFHCDCIFKWLPRNNCCPMCRTLCATVVHL